MISHSIIIPTFRRDQQLALALESLARQTAPRDSFEILVVDNACLKSTRKLVKSFQKQTPDLHLRFMAEPIPGLLAGRHHGLAQAQGETLSFIDDDIEADPGWLEAVLGAFTDPKVHMVGGPNLPKYEHKPPRWLNSLWSATPYGGRTNIPLSLIDLGPNSLEIHPDYIFGCNFSIRKQTVLDAKGFHPDTFPKHLQIYQGDGETGLTKKIAQLGLKTRYEPKARVHHWVPAARMTWDYFERRFYFQGVSDSYTAIRSLAESPDGEADSKISVPPFPNRWKELVRKLWAAPLAFPILRRRLKKAYAQGIADHIQTAMDDQDLMDWIIRPDYLDCYAPEAALQTSPGRPAKRSY